MASLKIGSTIHGHANFSSWSGSSRSSCNQNKSDILNYQCFVGNKIVNKCIKASFSSRTTSPAQIRIIHSKITNSISKLNISCEYSKSSYFGSSESVLQFKNNPTSTCLQKTSALKNSDNQYSDLIDDPKLNAIVGEDAAIFDISTQKLQSWINFTIVLGVVLTILYFIWLDPNTGFGGLYIDTLSSLSGSPEVTIVLILFVFALVHSGGAALRFKAEKIIGERAYRVLFAGLSLPLAVSAVMYFINHRYDGVMLWQITSVPGIHDLVWFLSFISFFFLYPSTFNLLEVAAVDKPKFHMWETGIMRITRHPQMTGQLIWCLAHTLWIGNSFTLVTSLALCLHHAFGVWHGDKRLSEKYGEAFDVVKSRTSIIPFAAILDGRQVLPEDYYKEFLRIPYFAIVFVTLGAYFCHPLMQQASYWLNW